MTRKWLGLLVALLALGWLAPATASAQANGKGPDLFRDDGL